MKKIQTAKIREQKAKMKKIIVGVVLISLMVVSTVGYSMMQGGSKEDTKEDTSKVEENGLLFYRQNEIWVTSINGKTFGFQYLPSEIVNVSVEGDYDLDRYSDSIIYYETPTGGVIEILNNLKEHILRYQGACLNDSGCEGDFPIKDCSSNVIISKGGNETRVYGNESCIYLVGDSIMAADAFLYKLLKVN
ncbi:MAG: hypothetical protein U9P50_00045 [Patescibacteria group bacterium]|nr:hypothetical protein [Patescibacteria group bacterium]